MSGVLSKSVWSDEVPPKKGVSVSVNDVAYSPDGTRCIVAAGSRVLLYDATDGNLIKSLRGHENTVYSVDFSADGSHFASGGADNSVVIWKISGQGKLKYPHSAAIQRVKYNPVSFQLASCSDVDFGLWMPDKKQVPKEKTGSRILSAAWSSDGATLALGLLNGCITLRNQDAEETHRIDRKAPVWCLSFIPNTLPSKTGSSNPEGEMLAVGCWDKTLTFYRILANGATKAHTERLLKYYPTSLVLAGNNANSKSHYLIISGSNRKVSLYSKEGIRLADLATKDTWVWGTAYNGMTERVILGTNVGLIDNMQLSFETLYSFEGKRLRVWRLESPVIFIKVDGGHEGMEGLLIGMENGAITKIYVDNPFPVEMMKRDKKIICADSSLYRTKIASVDSSNKLVVMDVKTHEPVFTAEGVVSVCFNSEVDDLLCYTTATNIYVVSGVGVRGGLHEPEEQHTQGFAVGFQGQKIYCLFRGQIQSIDVPQGANIQRAIENGDFDANWKQLAMRALRSNSIKVAKSAFERLKDLKYLSLIESITRDSSEGVASAEVGRSKQNTADLDLSVQAELLAYEGHHHEAAKTYSRAGRHEDAIRVFTDLRKWGEAKSFAQSAGHMDLTDLTRQQAEWLKEINDWRGASDMYLSMNRVMEAAHIIAESGESGWEEKLIELVRQASAADNREALMYCGEAFSGIDANEYARETYQKIGEVGQLINLYAKKKMWEEAGKLAEEADGKFDLSVMVPYAEWLVSQDKYEEAMKAYKRSGRPDLSRKVLAELTSNAVSESRFKDAAYYFWMLAKECEIDDEDMQGAEYTRKADLYFAYSSIHAYVTDPFTSHQPETLFQVSRFIINSLGNSDTIPLGISKGATMYTLARQAMILGTFKLARYIYDRLTKLQVPPTKQAEVELDMLSIQAKPIRDNSDHLPVCFRCSATNPLLNPFTSKFAKADVCTNCGHPFVRSFITFDNGAYVPVTVDRSTLLAMSRTEVFVCKPSSPSKRATFYKNTLPEIHVAISQPCHRFFHLEDFEFAYLSNRSCPYSRYKNVGEYGSL
eukprot:GSChrysophyteH1.ASY1.ANO1.1878.1 assembled CDS